MKVLRHLPPERLGAECHSVRATRTQKILRLRWIRELCHTRRHRIREVAGAPELGAKLEGTVALLARADATIAEILVLFGLRREQTQHDLRGLGGADRLLHHRVRHGRDVHRVRQLRLLCQVRPIVPILGHAAISAAEVPGLVQFLRVAIGHTHNGNCDENQLREGEQRDADDVRASPVHLGSTRQGVLAIPLELLVLVLVPAGAGAESVTHRGARRRS
mmetsp:Transcript_9653/g.27943  ORF Transcript_9653/g.27943 Transcript_9653/m.27943 type:complete len:219 (-) Transcript_9653:66-722(-)